MLEFGIGLTDLAKYIASATDAGISKHFDAQGVLDRMEDRSMGRSRGRSTRAVRFT